MTAHACQTELGTEVDQLLDVLSNRLRRAVIYYFEVQIDRTVESLSALATYLSKTIPELATNTAEVELVHTHLPMLNARAGSSSIAGRRRSSTSAPTVPARCWPTSVRCLRAKLTTNTHNESG